MVHLIGTGGANRLVAPQSSDTLEGRAGDDTLISDLDYGGAGHLDIILECEEGEGQDFAGGAGTSGGAHQGQNDLLDDGSGDDLVVGETISIEYGDLMLTALAGTGGQFGGPGGDDNAVDCYNDLWVAGSGNDQFIGDVLSIDGLDSGEMNAAAGSAGLGRFAFFPQPGGDGGQRNIVHAFNDFMSDDGPNAGDDRLIGDFFGVGGRGQVLNALAGVGGRGAGAGGDLNQVQAYNDLLNGASGSDQLIGDVFMVGGNDDTVLSALAGVGGEDGGGAGGSDNFVSAFGDTLLGGGGGDFIVGDVWQSAGASPEIQLRVEAGASPAGGGAGGAGNVVLAFNDRLLGGPGDDFLIGDSYRLAGLEDIEVTLSGAGGATIEAFQDDLQGGPGSDRLIGDFFADAPGDPLTLQVLGAFAGLPRLFADTLDGGAGGDALLGGLGADVLTGGPGADLFAWEAGDIFDLAAGVAVGTPPIDVVTDFAGDVIDLRVLLTSLDYDPAVHNINDWLRYSVIGGTDGLISIDQDGLAGSAAFLPMIELVGFTGGGSVGAMIAGGALLVPV